MSFPLNIPKSNSGASSQDRHYIIPPQAIRSAISAHQKQSARIVKSGTRHDELAELRTEFEAAGAAYFSGKMKQDDYDAVCKRLDEAHRAFRKRMADYGARRAAGLTKPGDLYKVLYGCTDEEVEEFVRDDRHQADVRRANEERSQSRVLQQSRHGRGH